MHAIEGASATTPTHCPTGHLAAVLQARNAVVLGLHAAQQAVEAHDDHGHEAAVVGVVLLHRQPLAVGQLRRLRVLVHRVRMVPYVVKYPLPSQHSKKKKKKSQL